MDPVRLQIGAEPFPPGMKDLESLPFGGVFDRRAVPDDQPASSTTFGLGRLRLGRHQRLALGGRVDRPPKLVGDGGDSSIQVSQVALLVATGGGIDGVGSPGDRPRPPRRTAGRQHPFAVGPLRFGNLRATPAAGRQVGPAQAVEKPP
jgi:hypothetical protein